MENLEKDGRVITCILPKGEALDLLKALYDKGVTKANFAFARGFDIHDASDTPGGIPAAVEKEIVTVAAKGANEAEDLFNFIYESGNVNSLGGGLMYMSKLHMSSGYELPDIKNQINDAQKTQSAGM